MIIWINCKVSDKRWTPIGNKGNLKSDNRFDITKYFFSSLVALSPLISKVLLNIELDDPYKGREEELELYVRSLFVPEKIGTIEWFRCNNMEQWKKVQSEIESIDDETIYVPGAEDHIFMDSSIDMWARGLELITKDQEFTAVFPISHFPETLRISFAHNSQLTECNRFVKLASYSTEVSSNYILKKELLRKYLEHNDIPNKTFFRIEDFSTFWPQQLYMPTKEQSRHYDGYTHVSMDLNLCPPIEIPYGFFEKNIVIRYGFNDRYPNCVNINPTINNLYSVDVNGTDYKWILDDIPLFWKPYITDIQMAPNIDHQAMMLARNQHLLKMSRAPVWGHSAPIPQEWIQSHML